MVETTTDSVGKAQVAFPKSLLLACLLFLITLVAYIPALQGGYIWDDDYYVVDNASWEALLEIWHNPRSHAQYYPLTMTSFWLEYRLWGKNPAASHLINILLHATNAVLLWQILKMLKIPGSWIIAAVFALHPVHVESVAWIAERKNTLSGVFYLTAMLYYLRFYAEKQHFYYFCALIFYTLALTAKTVTCSLPVILWIVIWRYQGQLKFKDVAITVPFFIIGVPMGLLTVHLEQSHIGAVGAEWDFSFGERLLIAARAWWFYLYKLVLPIQLTFIYPRWQIASNSIYQWLFVVAACLTITLLWFGRRRFGAMPLAAILFFSITIFPALGFFNLYPARFSFVADHFQYLASLGPIVLFIGGAIYLARRRAATALLIISVAILLPLLGILTFQQCKIYENKKTLWLDTLDKNPRALIAYNNLGLFYMEHGALNKAIVKYRQALQIKKDYVAAHHNLAVAYALQGNLAGVRKQHRKTIALQPKYVNSYNNLAFAYEKSGKIAKALQVYNEALAIEPQNPHIHNYIGTIHARRQHLPQALYHFEKAYDLKPDLPVVRKNLQMIYDKIGTQYWEQQQYRDAIATYMKAAVVMPDQASNYNNIANAYFQLGGFRQAIAMYEKALAANPNFAKAHANLGSLYLQRRRYHDALFYLRKAHRLDDQDSSILNQLGIACLALNKTVEAVANFRKAIAIDDQNANAHYHLGLAYFTQGQYQKAINAYQLVLTLTPERKITHLLLAKAHYRCRQYDQAVYHYRLATKFQIEVPQDFLDKIRPHVKGN